MSTVNIDRYWGRQEVATSRDCFEEWDDRRRQSSFRSSDGVAEAKVKI